MKTVEILRSFERDGGFPIDASTVFFSYEEAEAYAHFDLSAYPTQVIGVDDKATKTTGLYKIDYDPKGIFKHILKPIGVGNGSSVFNFKTTVETIDDLPKTNVAEGDLYLVLSKNTLYVAFIDKFNDISWKPVGVDLQYASRRDDGIVTSKFYKTLFNDNEEDSLYFSKKSSAVDPENNTWISISHTIKENNENYSIPSMGKVKELIGNFINTNSCFSITSDISTEAKSGQTINPELTISYNKNLGGCIKNIKITKIINDVETEIDYIDSPSTIINNEKNIETFIWKDKQTIIGNAHDCITYEITLGHTDSNGLLTSLIYDINKIVFNFYDWVTYGTNNEIHETLLKGNMDIDLKYFPSKCDSITNKIFIIIPITADIDYIEYVQQHDMEALDLFDTVLTTSTKEYNFILGENCSFKSNGEYIFHVLKGEQ